MMNLHLDKTLFSDIAQEASYHLKIDKEIIIHDYFVSHLLEKIFFENKYYVFKGGTSLSKCYRIIDRYSEDIDLGIDVDFSSFTTRQKKDTNKRVLNSVKSSDLDLLDEKFRSGRDYNTIKVNLKGKDAYSSSIKIETFFEVVSFPCEETEAKTYIYDFLKSKNREDLIGKYNLNPIKVKTQNYVTTFIEKIFAICDYYETDDFNRNSRHLYDLKNLYERIRFDDEFFKTFDKVREIRFNSRSETRLSAKPDYDIVEGLKNIIKNKSFKNDYNKITTTLIFYETSYEECENVLKKILEKFEKRSWFL